MLLSKKTQALNTCSSSESEWSDDVEDASPLNWETSLCFSRCSQVSDRPTHTHKHYLKTYLDGVSFSSWYPFPFWVETLLFQVGHLLYLSELGLYSSVQICTFAGPLSSRSSIESSAFPVVLLYPYERSLYIFKKGFPVITRAGLLPFWIGPLLF